MQRPRRPSVPIDTYDVGAQGLRIEARDVQGGTSTPNCTRSGYIRSGRERSELRMGAYGICGTQHLVPWVSTHNG
jgi:hypothetical protein